MPLLASRTVSSVLGAPFQIRHYKAFGKMSALSGSFLDVLARYLTGKGKYPFACSVKTPRGMIAPTLFSYYDLLTLNEVFFREDYAATASDRVVVDVGSNIGLSALYFLTRNDSSLCFLYEPDPRNIGRMKHNLSGYSARCVINSSAVSDESGRLRFGLDVNSGRYGGLEAEFGHYITVNCLHINSVLREVLDRHQRIDILKIDTEGTEVRTIKAIDREFLPKIGKIYFEAAPGAALHPDVFHQEQYGTVCRLINNMLFRV